MIPTPEQLIDPKTRAYLHRCVDLSNQLDRFVEMLKIDQGTAFIALGFMLARKAKNRDDAEKIAKDLSIAIIEAHTIMVLDEASSYVQGSPPARREGPLPRAPEKK